LLMIKDFLQAMCNLDWNSGIFNKIHHPLFLKLCVGQLNIFVLALVFKSKNVLPKKRFNKMSSSENQCCCYIDTSYFSCKSHEVCYSLKENKWRSRSSRK
jgi:hypothetical protein